MKKQFTFRLKPAAAADNSILKKVIAAESGHSVSSVTGYHILKSSIDARSRQVFITLTLEAFINEPFQIRETRTFHFHDVSKAEKRVVIIGAGPAGLFAALQLIENGIKPVILERGKDVKARRRDLAILNKEGIINPESNYCFGEGGAGTYSDGKLYTRSTKRGDVSGILNLFVHFGADEKILYEAHPHIGTNKLPQIIEAIRKKIIDCGGEIFFQKKLIDFVLEKETIIKAKAVDGTFYAANAFILATGHSARDIFFLLHSKKILTGFKPFALGVRVEHPQSLIDSIQYHCEVRDENLPPATYSLVQQVDSKGVFSFCMCPGGIIAPASTNPGELVVNGWSPSKRNNPYANSGIVVAVEEKDISGFHHHGVLAGLYFQQEVEQKAFIAGGGKFVAPAQRMVDFSEDKRTSSLPDCSYLPGINTASLKEVLPSFINDRLKKSFKEFGHKMRGYFTNEAVIVATESRTSSPVRIPRNEKTLNHPQINNLYPCGEGAGYAGGIVSAALDGEKVANAIAQTFKMNNKN
ncbi:MAG TPA: NAD(P)/FAD-dependent oxidoreductase [Chitinophagaceae bacterium]|nr:NAD(P)/FAD-dependent oxidoreductase [Chitinophagaceae bacterium]